MAEPLPRWPPAAVRVLEVAGGALRPAERPPEPPAPGEVVVAVAACALGAAEVVALGAPPGTCPGRAVFGRVAAAGDGVRGLAPGTPVVAPSRLACGACAACRRGRAEACVAPARPAPGGLAAYARVPARDLVALEGGLARLAGAGAGWELAAAGSVLLLAYTGLARAGVMPGEVVLVAGADAAGLAAVQVAVAGGAHAVAVDPEPSRLDAARRCGARGVVPCAGASPGGVAAEIDGWCAAEGLAAARRTVVAPGGGRGHLLRAAALVDPGGALVLLGRPADGAALEAAPLAARGASVVALEDGHPDLLVETLALCARGAVNPGAIARPFAAADAAAAVSALRRGDDARLPVILFGDD